MCLFYRDMCIGYGYRKVYTVRSLSFIIFELHILCIVTVLISRTMQDLFRCSDSHALNYRDFNTAVSFMFWLLN